MMKTVKLTVAVIIFVVSANLFAQDILQSSVPSVIINNFKEAFPKASDIEWEQHAEQYKVEFEIGFFSDHEAWFSASGEMVTHIEEISKKDMPKAVKTEISSKFEDFRIDNVDKVTENKQVTYKVELEKRNEEHTVIFSEGGNIIN